MKYAPVVMVIGVCLMLMVKSSYSQADSNCSKVMCRMYCPYGFKQDDDGCDICKCNDKTEIREGQCPRVNEDVDSTCDDACAHDGDCPPNQKCCSNGCGHACMDIVRDGYCPVSSSFDGTDLAGDASSSGGRADLCSTDEECTDDSTYKCCENTSGENTCIAPDMEKQGTCPIGTLSEGSLGLCADICSRDSDCPSLQKCCSNGCGHVCITPVDLLEVHSGSCSAPPPPQGAGTCAEECKNDGACMDTHKCCRNGCGAYSCTEAIDIPVKCPDVMCLRWCAYGFKKNDDGCDTCDCAEQTEIHNGECPVTEAGDFATCAEECDHDGDCEDNQKCCSNGCGHVCMASKQPDPEGCQINAYPDGQLGACVDDCDPSDQPCEAGELCCSNGCGHDCFKQVTVHEGTCPTGELELGRSGICVEMCNNDGQCAANQKCCSNGCGHACVTVETLPATCSEAAICLIFCEYGNKKNDDGCIICECQEPGEAGVERPGECPVGLLPEGIVGSCQEDCSSDYDCTDKSQKCCSNGCGHECVDALNVESQCPPVLCTRYCENGLQTDENGCEICMCNEEQKCGNIKCQMHCSYGYKEDKYGCNICECEDTPSKCKNVNCEIFCIYGFQRDPEGCEKCECTPGVSALKTGSCPAVVGDPPASCADLCDNDDECTGDEKCCFNGCGYVCMMTGGGSGRANVPVSPIMLLVLTFVSMLASSKL